jgi:HK97 family phage portal protein
LANRFTDFFKRRGKDLPELAVSNSSADQRSTLVSVADGELFLKKLGLDSLRVQVNAENAMGIATFYSCVKFISNQCAALPYNVYRSGDDGAPRRERSHPLDFILETRFNKNMGAFVARRTMYLNLLVHGWAVAQIKRDRYNQPYEIIPFPCSKVFILHEETTDSYFFDVPHINKRFSQDDVIFLKDLNFDGAIGYSVLNWQKQTIKIDLLTKKFTEKYYENGTYMGGIIIHPQLGGLKDEDAAKTIKERVLRAFEGENGGAGIAILPKDSNYIPIGLPPDQSKLVEIFNMSRKDIAMLFGIPLSILGDTEVQSSWGAGVEQMNINLVNYVFVPIATQTEQEFDYKCLRRDEILHGCYTKHNFRGLLRGDLKAQAEYAAKMVSNGIHTPDEQRYYDDKAPLPGGVGAKAYMNGSMNSLDIIEEVKTGNKTKNGTRKTGTSSDSQ